MLSFTWNIPPPNLLIFFIGPASKEIPRLWLLLFSFLILLVQSVYCKACGSGPTSCQPFSTIHRESTISAIKRQVYEVIFVGFLCFVFNFYLGLLKPTGFDWLSNDYKYSQTQEGVYLEKAFAKLIAPFPPQELLAFTWDFDKPRHIFSENTWGKDPPPNPQTFSFTDYDF